MRNVQGFDKLGPNGIDAISRKRGLS